MQMMQCWKIQWRQKFKFLHSIDNFKMTSINYFDWLLMFQKVRCFECGILKSNDYDKYQTNVWREDSMILHWNWICSIWQQFPQNFIPNS